MMTSTKIDDVTRKTIIPKKFFIFKITVSCPKLYSGQIPKREGGEVSKSIPAQSIPQKVSLKRAKRLPMFIYIGHWTQDAN